MKTLALSIFLLTLGGCAGLTQEEKKSYEDGMRTATEVSDKPVDYYYGAGKAPYPEEVKDGH